MKQGKTISTILFSVITVFQLVFLRYVMNNAALQDVPMSMILEVAVTLLIAVVAVKMFACEQPLSTGAKKALALGGALYLIQIAIYYDVQLSMLGYGLMMFSQSLAAGVIPMVVLVIKAALVAAAVVFAVISVDASSEEFVEVEEIEQEPAADAQAEPEAAAE